MSRKDQYERMTKTPIAPLILTLGIPTTISMLISNIYNMADTFFVSKISLSASGATGIVFSVMAILQAFGFMYGHGAGSHISIMLGAKNTEKARTLCSTSFFLALVTGLLIGAVGIIFIEPFMYLLGSTDTILESAKIYAFYILIAGPAFTISCVLNNILRYEGLATFSMFGLVAGGVLNMIMDPILIFYLGLGVAGAGLSTTISQYISMFILLCPFVMRKTISSISFSSISREKEDYRKIFYTGASSFLRQALNSLSTTCLNIAAKAYGDAAIAAMSIVGRVSNLIFSTCLGVAQGYQPVAAFNYGSKHYDRVKEGMVFTTAFGTVMMILVGGVCYVFAPDIISMFRSEALVIEIGTAALRMLCVAIALQPLIFVGNILFQCTGHGGMSIILVVMQSGLFFIPLVLLLPGFIGLSGIELARPISYLLSAVVTLPLILRFFKELDRRMEYEADCSDR